MRQFCSLVLVLTLTACQNVPYWQREMFDHPPGNRQYHPNYIKGWQDGCESGAQASANHMYRFIYKYRQDWRLLNDAQYVKGWDDAYNQCQKYLYQHNLKTLG
jgi:hypothetical protein